MHMVERVKEGFLRMFFSRHELDIVYQQDVRAPVLPSEFTLCPITDGFDEVAQEFLGGDVGHLLRRALRKRVVTDGLEQVRFAQAYSAVDD